MRNPENNAFSDLELVGLYDTINSGTEDHAFYWGQAPEHMARILDVGCGTGVLAIGFWENGHEVVGIDPQGAMIAYCREKLEDDRLTWEVCDLPNYRATSDFDLVTMTGHAFQCLLTDEEILTFFECVRDLLGEKGALLFESRNPDLKPWEKWDGYSDELETGEGEKFVVTTEVMSFEEEVLEFKETFLLGEGQRRKVSRSRLRFAAKDAILDLAGQAGLQLEQMWGDWEGNAFDPKESREMIFRLGRLSKNL